MKHVALMKTALLLSALGLVPTVAMAQAQTPVAAPAPQTGQASPELVEGESASETIIAVPPFATPQSVDTPAGNTAELGQKLAAVMVNDLSGTSAFSPLGPDGLRQIGFSEVTAPAFPEWAGRNAENLVHGYVRANPDGTLSVGCYLYDVSLQSQLTSQAYVVPPSEWRRAAHKCADAMYSRLSGESPFFDSRIVYVSEMGPKDRRVKRIAIMDSDGANHRFLTNGQNIVLTPRYSPDYTKILYLSYVGKRPHIYVLDVATGQQRLVTQSANQTFSPRWSPDGKTILYSMEVGGTTDIYTVATSGEDPPQRLTSGPGISTGGSYSPDGKRIVFESDRSGGQQIYVMNADGSGQQRISFGEGQYATPEWNPRGHLIAFTKIGGGFRVGVMNPSGSGERLLTNSWQDEAPTWSPNGRVIQFFRTSQGSGKTSVWQVDVTGSKERKIQTKGDGSDPSWGAILQ
jgi:TolB protein